MVTYETCNDIIQRVNSKVCLRLKIVCCMALLRTNYSEQLQKGQLTVFLTSVAEDLEVHHLFKYSQESLWYVRAIPPVFVQLHLQDLVS